MLVICVDPVVVVGVGYRSWDSDMYPKILQLVCNDAFDLTVRVHAEVCLAVVEPSGHVEDGTSCFVA